MYLLEIIEIRISQKNRAELISNFNELLKSLTEKNEVEEFRIYKRFDMESDFSIHIYYDKKKSDESGSKLGLRLVDHLKGFGLINHHQWIEIGKH